jgi:hypothetical protein
MDSSSHFRGCTGNSDDFSLTEQEQKKLIEAGEPFIFSHSLEDLIAGQTDAGLVITGLYEDIRPGKPLSNYMPSMIATRARKPSKMGGGD